MFTLLTAINKVIFYTFTFLWNENVLSTDPKAEVLK